jgi:tetratricopeptide (TPR) repeat protein
VNDARWQLSQLIEVGRYREALEILQRELSHAPHDPDLHVLGARAALGEKDEARAGEHVRHALAADPQHFEARVLLFVLCCAGKRHAQAEELIVALIRERPDSAALLALYAELMLTTMHLDKARALTEEALRRDPDDHRARVVNVLLLTIEGKRGDAGQQLAELIRDDPESTEIAYTLLRVLIEQQRHAEALEVGRQLLRLDPDNRALVEALAELRAATHWIALPAYPLRRFGWAGSAGMWVGALLSIRLAAARGPEWAGVLSALWVAYVLYSWVHAPLLKRWLMRRGF